MDTYQVLRRKSQPSDFYLCPIKSTLMPNLAFLFYFKKTWLIVELISEVKGAKQAIVSCCKTVKHAIGFAISD